MSERQEQHDFPLQKHGTCRNEEDDDGNSTPQVRKEDWHSSGGDQQGGYELQPSHVQKDDGDVEMGRVQKPQVRHDPSIVEQDKKEMKLLDEGSLCDPVCTSTKHLEKGTGENTQDESKLTWFKVKVLGGIKYEKTWLINSFQSHCSVPFTPVDFHYMKGNAVFFVQDANTASELKDLSNKICDEENQKVSFIVNTSSIPYTVRDELEPKEIEQLKLTLKKRYDVSQKALDLYKLRFDPDFAHLDIDIKLNRRNCMVAILQIIKKDFPELLSLNLRRNKLYNLDELSNIIHIVPTLKILNLSRNQLKSTWQLGKIRGLNLEQLWLYENPLCYTFPNRSTYRSAIRKYFPKLLCLDGQNLDSSMTDRHRQQLIRSSKESGAVPGDQKGLVLQFLRQYYLIYDSGDRQDLLNAYHDEACFSLAISVNPDDPASSSLFEYLKENRNMKNLQDPTLRFQLLKHTKQDIMCSLSLLPKTRHDLRSFTVDLWFMSGSKLFFSVSGLFTEVEGRSQGCVRAFTRTFVTIPASSSSLCVVNEELFVRDATPKKTDRVLSANVPPASSSEPALSQEQQEMVLVFSIHSGMKSQWSEKYLRDNEWNYNKAVEVFTAHKTEGKIPKEAFKQIR